MDKKVIDEVLEMGTLLGRRQAFAMVAGRCSAADAQCLRDLRESKKYKLLGLTWEEYCKQHVGIARSTAEVIIRHLEEFGPDYFTLAQVTGISAPEYRRLAGAVSGHALLHAGQAIPIEAENSARLVAAVDALRSQAGDSVDQAPDPPRPRSVPANVSRGLAAAQRSLHAGLAELDRVRVLPMDSGDRMRLQTTILEAVDKLKWLDLQVKA